MKKGLRKVVVYLMTIAMLFSVTGINKLSVEAASYPSIMLSGVPYFPQKISGDCGISSIAMIEGYALGYGAEYFDALYDEVYAANGSLSIGNAVNNGKYTDITKDLSSVYNQLKQGKPVLIYRTGSDHWSVVVGYNGSTSTLEKSGFIVYNTAHGTKVGQPYTSKLSDWLSGNTWKHAKVRNSGAINSITTNVSSVTLQNVCYPTNLKKGSGMGSSGLLIAKGAITQVSAGVKTHSGTVKFSASATPNSKYFSLLNFDSSMKFGSLPAGNYIYYVSATDSAWGVLYWEQEFSVSSSATSLRKTTITGDGDGGNVTPSSAIFSLTRVTDVSTSDATIHADLNNTYYVSTAGFYFGTDPNNLTKYTENANCNAKTIYYGMNKWVGTLRENTDYYWKIYAVVNGVEYITDLQWFKTLAPEDKNAPVITNVQSINVTREGYTVVCQVTDDLSGVERVCFPTWTEANGQDDINPDWYSNAVGYTTDGITYYFDVKVSDHNYESGNYTTHVYAYDKVGNYQSAGIDVTINRDIPLQGFTLSHSNFILKVNESQQLSVIAYMPSDTTVDRTVSWSSSNTSIVAVNSNGIVTAMGTGTAIITATVGGKSATCIVTVNAEVTPTPPSDGTQDSVKAFVERMYTVALGRAAESDGANWWTQELLNGTSDGAGLANGFLRGSEFINKGYSNSQYVKVLYATFFDRQIADGEGDFWINGLNSGSSRESVLAGFVNSEEFFNLCASYGISRGVMYENGEVINSGIGRFAERLYTEVLGRAGEEGGMEYWATAIANGSSTPEDAAKSFFTSTEYLNKNTSNPEYVITLYRTFMGRDSDIAGLCYWVDTLNANVSREEVLNGFATSAEFKKIMASYGL